MNAPQPRKPHGSTASNGPLHACARSMNLRHAYRFLLRTPGFALFAILELALGIGLTTTAFFVVNAVLLRPLDLPAPNQLVEILSTNKKTGKTHNTAPGLDFRDLRDRTSAFTSMSAYFDKS